MKIVLIANHIFSLPVLNYLASQQVLQAVVVDEEVNVPPVAECAKNYQVQLVKINRRSLTATFRNWLYENEPDLVLVFTLDYKIPAELLEIPVFGFYNIHFSLLPAYKGPAPVFWQIKNGGANGGITIHKMDEEFDSGPILLQQPLPLFQGESYGLYAARLSQASADLVKEMIAKLNKADVTLTTPAKADESYFPRARPGDYTIKWAGQTAAEIENLVNACNPYYGGAITYFRGQQIRILEVSVANINATASLIPGSVVHADINYGIFVQCYGGLGLRIAIVQAAEGFLSGYKLIALGVNAGERFTDLPA